MNIRKDKSLEKMAEELADLIELDIKDYLGQRLYDSAREDENDVIDMTGGSAGSEDR